MIPEAAVEAAAAWLPHAGDCYVRPERDCTCWQPRVNRVRAALEAAAPHMLAGSKAEALMEAADAWREYLPAVAGYGNVQPVPVWLERRSQWITHS